MAQFRFVIFIATVGGYQPNRDFAILPAQILDQLSGGKAGADDQDTGVHFASEESGSNTSLPMAHSGHRKSSGTSCQQVPGATSCIGSPNAGS
ncbi:hypothetical protein D3C81_2086290 [compost metagenome]